MSIGTVNAEETVIVLLYIASLINFANHNAIEMSKTLYERQPTRRIENILSAKPKSIMNSNVYVLAFNCKRT